MTTHGRGLSRLLMGSVADKVLRGGTQPVLLYCPANIRAEGRRARRAIAFRSHHGATVPAARKVICIARIRHRPACFTRTRLCLARFKPGNVGTVPPGSD
jgi:hypothetical protein